MSTHNAEEGPSVTDRIALELAKERHSTLRQSASKLMRQRAGVCQALVFDKAGLR